MKKGGAFATFKILHTALLTGPILFIGVLFYLNYSKSVVPALADLDKIFQILAIALAAAGFFIGTNLFKKKLLEIRDTDNDVQEKFAQYRAACMVQWAMLEGPAIFSGICFFLTGNYAFLAFAAFQIIMLGLQAPNKLKIALQLGVAVEDLDTL